MQPARSATGLPNRIARFKIRTFHDFHHAPTDDPAQAADIDAAGHYLGVGGVLVGASSLVSWQKPDVTAVVLVRPYQGGFVAVDSEGSAETWQRTEVQPVVLVKPSISDFVPWEGSSIGNRWRRDEVVPVTLVEPDSGVFVPHKRTRGAAVLDNQSSDLSDRGPRRWRPVWRPGDRAGTGARRVIG